MALTNIIDDMMVNKGIIGSVEDFFSFYQVDLNKKFVEDLADYYNFLCKLPNIIKEHKHLITKYRI